MDANKEYIQQTEENEFSKTITASKRKPNKVKSDRGKDFRNRIVHNLPILNIRHHFPRFSHKIPSKTEGLTNIR